MENKNLTLNTIIELASKITVIEERISQLYLSLNALLSSNIQIIHDLESLKKDTINQLVLVYNELDSLNKDS